MTGSLGNGFSTSGMDAVTIRSSRGQVVLEPRLLGLFRIIDSDEVNRVSRTHTN